MTLIVDERDRLRERAGDLKLYTVELAVIIILVDGHSCTVWNANLPCCCCDISYLIQVHTK